MAPLSERRVSVPNIVAGVLACHLRTGCRGPKSKCVKISCGGAPGRVEVVRPSRGWGCGYSGVPVMVCNAREMKKTQSRMGLYREAECGKFCHSWLVGLCAADEGRVPLL